MGNLTFYEIVKDDYQLWRDLVHRLGFGEKYFPWATEEEAMQWTLEPSGISLEELRKHPEGLVYKPLRYKKYKTRPLLWPRRTHRHVAGGGQSALQLFEFFEGKRQIYLPAQ